MASIRGILNIQSLNELTSEKCAFWGMMVNGAIWIRAPTSPRRGAALVAAAV